MHFKMFKIWQKWLLTLVCGCFHLFTNSVCGQNILNNNFSTDPALNSMPTPQAASIALYNRLHPSLANGMLNISLPIYELPVKGHSIGVSIGYQSGGIKPNERGGCLGVGWSLVASGSITRVQNGIPDESVNASYTDSLLGYYWNKSQLNKSNWDQFSALDSLRYSIPCNGSPSGCIVGTPQWHDWAPDEFLFNFAGYTGSFWLDNTGTWQIRENTGEKLSITSSIGTYSFKYPTAAQSLTVQHVLQNFTITDGLGNIFVFGGDNNSIEFNRNLNASNSATATSWYLTQVTTGKGERVTYTYQRIYPSASVFTSMNCYQVNYTSNVYNWNLQYLSGVLHDPVYLQQISYGKLALQFKYSKSTINSYCCKPTNPYIPSDTIPTTDVSTYISGIGSSTEPSSSALPIDYKLDSIIIGYQNSTRLFTFSYLTSTNRLFLQSLTEGYSASGQVNTHQFQYNGTSFYISSDPSWLIQDGLLTSKVDHWGFYNGKLPFKTSDLPLSGPNYVTAGNNSNGFSYPSTDFITNYYSNRQPIFDSAKIGSLSRIIYPLGGYTDYVYELNDYAYKINPVSDTAIFNGSNASAGGLRIKQVISHADPYSVSITKLYRYIGDNGYSSGVLNSTGILYQDSLLTTNGHSINYTFRNFYDNNQIPLVDPDPSPVIYSRVDEINADSGKIVHRFYNHNNGHFDLLPNTSENITANAYYYRQSNSRTFHRGKDFASGIYDSLGTHAYQSLTSFKNDDSLTANHVGVRSYSIKSKDIRAISYLAGNGGVFTDIYSYASLWPINVSAYVHYLHYYPIIHKADTLFDATSYVATTDSFTYNSSNNKIANHIKSNLSDGSSKIETLNYPADLVSGNSFYGNMVTQNVIDPVINKAVTDNAGKLLGNVHDSLTQKTVSVGSLYLLYNRQSYEVSTAKRNLYIYKYDSVANPVWLMGADSTPVVYKWDYSSIYPVATIRNATDTTIAYTSFEAEGNNNWNVPDTVRDYTYNMTGAKSYDLTNAKTISASVTAGKQFIVSYWSRNGSVTVKSNGTSASVSLTGLTKNGFTYYEHTLPNTTTSVTVTGPSASAYVIDELRLYPIDAQMTTYTYTPLMGVSSVSSPANQIIYHTYDGLRRVSSSLDMDRNVTGAFGYQTQQLAKQFYNDLQSGTHNKNNCGAGYTGTAVTYYVPANTYSSQISKADANSKAISDVTANSQNYANANGLCYVSLTSTNYVSVSGFVAAYTLVSSGITYYCNVSSSSGLQTLGAVPPGVYNLTISKSGNVTTYSFGNGCGTMSSSGTSATFNNITISTSNCNSIFINNVF